MGCELLRKLIKEIIFNELPNVLPKYVGPASRALLFEAFKDSMTRVLSKEEFKIGSGLKGITDLFELLSSVGFEFEYEVNNNAVKVSKCPFKTNTSDYPCVICLALVSAVFQRDGKRVRLEIDRKHKLGNPRSDVTISVESSPSISGCLIKLNANEGSK